MKEQILFNLIAELLKTQEGEAPHVRAEIQYDGVWCAHCGESGPQKWDGCNWKDTIEHAEWCPVRKARELLERK